MNPLEYWYRPIYWRSKPTLVLHLAHMAGSEWLVQVVLLAGVYLWPDSFDRLTAGIVVSLAMVAIEAISFAFLGEGLGKALFDSWQYQAHWIIYCWMIGSVGWVVLGVFVVGYFTFLFITQ